MTMESVSNATIFFLAHAEKSHRFQNGDGRVIKQCQFAARTIGLIEFHTGLFAGGGGWGESKVATPIFFYTESHSFVRIGFIT